MTPEVKLLAVTHVSNVLGTVNPVREICREARKRGIITVVDGSQAVPHRKVDVAAIGCDFYAITGHKMCGPTGTGALWARREHLDAMPPFLGGGEMIKEVSFDGTVFNDAPHKFEAGTPNIAGFIGLGVAADYLQQLGQENVEAREAELLAHFTEELRRVDGLRIIGEAPEKAAVVSFLIDGAHAHDLATLLDLEGVAVRSGQHCAHPLLQYFGVAATCRASLAFYNTHAEIERFMTALTKVAAGLMTRAELATQGDLGITGSDPFASERALTPPAFPTAAVATAMPAGSPADPRRNTRLDELHIAPAPFIRIRTHQLECRMRLEQRIGPATRIGPIADQR
jgi:cysteine desulfurase/selenocysteine lyase